MGGNDSINTFDDVLLLSWDPASKRLTQSPLPSLPKPCAFGSATLIGDVVYLAGGMSGSQLSTAMKNFWSLDLSTADDAEAFQWRELPAWPGPERALNVTAAQRDRVYVMSGRRQNGESVDFLKDIYEFSPSTREWRARGCASVYNGRNRHWMGSKPYFHSRWCRRQYVGPGRDTKRRPSRFSEKGVCL